MPRSRPRPLRSVLLAILIAASPLAATAEDGLTGAYLGARSAEINGDLVAAARLYTRAVQFDAENDLLREKAMIFSVAVGDIAGALRHARTLEERGAESRQVPLLLAVEEIRVGAFPNALRRIEAHRAAFSDLLYALLGGWAALVDDEEDAQSRFAALTGNDTLRAFGLYHATLALAVSGRLEDAARMIEAGDLGFLARQRRVVRAEAEILAAADHRASALARIDAAAESGISDPGLADLRRRIAAGAPIGFTLVPNATEGVAEALYGFALALGNAEQSRNYAVMLTRLALYLRPDLAEARLLLAELLQTDGQYDLAIAVLAEVPADSPQFLRAETARAAAMAAAGRMDEAIGVLTGLARSYPSELEPALALADTLRRQERYAEAAEAYTTAIGLVGAPQPRHWTLFYHRGICFERSGEWDRAEADFRKALELEPDQPSVLNYLGYSLADMGRNYAEAEEMIRKAVAKRPRDGYIIDSLAWVLYRLGRYEEAVEPMERAVSLVPNDPILNDHLGDILWMVGRRMEARFQWRRALSFGPEESEIPRIRRKLEVGLTRVLEEEGAKPAVPRTEAGDGG
ncbi:MAG: tetratricopeptide repeat protein [Alphaproteobacteria bacterium]|nr:MAG: tetratricopeptide repeat protein [Alphaproteobacteria bacterium]